MNVYELTPMSRKSFYGKAKVIQKDGAAFLLSYDTIVAAFDGKLHRTWDGYSATTMNHIRAFAHNFALPVPDRSTWEQMEVEKKEDFGY